MENHRINKILQALTEKFPENWADTYISEVENTLPETIVPEGEGVIGNVVQQVDKDRLKEAVNDSIDFFFDSLIISVLSGEYISNNEFGSELQKLDDFINRNFSYFGDETIQAVFDSEIKNNLVGSTKIAINLYKTFYKLLETLSKYPNIDIISVSNPTVSKLINDTNLEITIKEKLEFFNLTIGLTRYDHFLRDDIGFYQDLIEIELHIKNATLPPSTPNQFSVVLREKVQYLKYKWEIRQRTLYGKKNHIYMKSYLTDGELTFIDKNAINRSQETTLSKWQEYLESHYELGEWKSKIETDINNINRVNLSEVSILDIHKLIKYYKDVNPNYVNLSEIVSEVEKRMLTVTLETHTYNKIYAYALNNQFSSLLIQDDVDENDIINLKKKIDSFQSKTKIDNFFVEYKYIDFLLRKIELSYNTREGLDSITSTNLLIEKVETVIQAYSKNLNWSKNHYHCVFQLPYTESLVDCIIPELPKVYYSSSFVLPLSRVESQDNFDDLIMKYNKLSTSIKVITSLTKEFSIIKTTTDSLKDNDFKSIEVIGVFSAIITFIMASIPALAFIDNIWKALLFFISIAGSLGMFLLIIFSIRKGVSEFRKNTIYIFSFFALLLIILSCIYAINSQKTSKTETVKNDKSKSVNNKDNQITHPKKNEKALFPKK
ncbi:hypothetical protein AAYQ05_00940 [Flavobacterium sp. B11]|uniref:hypothetical protein n=1 Tax=Flavobacterium movens TaxID=214860 RepID=UPI0031D5B363